MLWVVGEVEVAVDVKVGLRLEVYGGGALRSLRKTRTTQLKLKLGPGKGCLGSSALTPSSGALPEVLAVLNL